MQKIMIIEDESSIRDELALLLGNEGYTAIPVTDFTGIPIQIKSAQPNLILLDVILPGRDGFALCAEIRRESSIPIIFVTSRDTAMDELQALNMGGDDYITKPYNIPLLLARIKTVLRRSSTHTESDITKANGLTLDLAKGTAAANGKSTELTRNEIRILAYLMSMPGQIVSRADLIEALWNSQIYIDDNTLSVNITRLRTKLESLGLPDYIKTRRGLGYQI
ncbi:MAG: response regulator transcription factor [Lachnospiraceae bacterium]